MIVDNLNKIHYYLNIETYRQGKEILTYRRKFENIISCWKGFQPQFQGSSLKSE